MLRNWQRSMSVCGGRDHLKISLHNVLFSLTKVEQHTLAPFFFPYKDQSVLRELRLLLSPSRDLVTQPR